MKRVTGIGGIFFKGQNADDLRTWYREHLGIPVTNEYGYPFKWKGVEDPDEDGATIFSIFAGDTDYFAPSKSSFMVNYRVDDLHALLAKLREEGVKVDEKIDESEYGKFGWAYDPDGNKIELWEPPAEMPAE